MDDKQRMKELKRRRVNGVRLLESGVWPAEVARRLGTSRQTVMRWERAIEAGGRDRLVKLGVRGRPRRLSDEQLHELGRLLKQGALAAHWRTDPTEVRSALGQQLGLAGTRTDGLERATPCRPGAPTRRTRHLDLEEQEVAGTKTIAARQRRIVVFIDESDLSERPCRART